MHTAATAEEAHVNVEEEINLTIIDTGEASSLTVTTNCVNVTTKDCAGQDEVVDHDEHTHDNEHVRNTTVFTATREGEQVGYETNNEEQQQQS